MGALPEALRPKPGHLSHSQQRVYEDFIRVPWQNQSSQTSNLSPVGPSTSVSSGLSQAYGSTSSQLNYVPYSTLGNTGMGDVAHSLNLGPEELDAGPPKQLSVSTMPSRFAEGVVQQNFESDAIHVSYPSAPTSGLQSTEQTIASKESGVFVQSLPSTSTTK